MSSPSFSTGSTSIVVLVGLLVVVTAIVFGIEALFFYAAPLLSFGIWYYAALHQGDRGLSPRNDRPEDPTDDTQGQYVAPMSLVVVSMRVPESDPIDVVVWRPLLRNFNGVLSPEHVIGRLARSRKDGGSLEPGNFLEHEVFVRLLHQFLERELPGRPALQKESRRTQDGWVRCLDARVLDAARPAPGSEPDAEDVFGRFRVQGGAIEPGSYERNPAHRLLTAKGLFQLEFALRERLQQEIIALHAFRQAGDVASHRVM